MRTSTAIILCYHKVGPVAEEGRRLNVEPHSLENQVRFFLRRGWQSTLVRDLSEVWNPRLISFTFDDCYSSCMQHTPEILSRHGARGTFYAVPAHVGGSSEWDGETARALADWDVLAAAERAGHEVANHTLGHPHLDALEIDDQRRQIQRGKEELEARAFSPGSFCYPYGRQNEQTQAVLTELGYRVAVGLGKRPARSGDNRLNLPRIVVAYSDALPMLMYKIHVKPLLKRIP